jgi:epsilon-lactone hydrolase
MFTAEIRYKKMPSKPRVERSDFKVAQDGTIAVPAFDLPLSPALSDQYKTMLAFILSSGFRVDIPDGENQSETEFKNAVDKLRALSAAQSASVVNRLLLAYPVRITQSHIGDIAVEEIVPTNGVDTNKVLINLNGGACICGWPYIGRMESIPIAHMGSFRVVSVDYRHGYEHKFPAASEDVAIVYRELLKQYAPHQIGIYGTSADGMLTAQAIAWFIEHELPNPGAIAILSAGTGGAGDGDYFGAIGSADTTPFGPMGKITEARNGYFSSAKKGDYLVDPALAPEAFRAKFPPTLLITGTRAFDLSPALALHRALVQANVDASLHVFDGVGHGFFCEGMSPESVDAYTTIIRFFKKNLR